MGSFGLRINKLTADRSKIEFWISPNFITSISNRDILSSLWKKVDLSPIIIFCRATSTGYILGYVFNY